MIDHPILPCGFNADDNNGDEIDGAGTNWPVWPVLYSTFEGKYVLFISDEMMAAFGDTCPDYVIPAEYRLVTIPVDNQYVGIGYVWPDIAMPEVSNVILFPAMSSTFVISAEPDTLDMSESDDIHTVRRKA